LKKGKPLLALRHSPLDHSMPLNHLDAFASHAVHTLLHSPNHWLPQHLGAPIAAALDPIYSA
jgi:hypothetical protein